MPTDINLHMNKSDLVSFSLLQKVNCYGEGKAKCFVVMCDYKAVFISVIATLWADEAHSLCSLQVKSASGPLSQDPLPGWLEWGKGPHTLR